MASLLAVMECANTSGRLSQAPGLLQAFDPRVRLLALGALIGFCVSARHLLLLLGALGLVLLIARLSRVPLAILARGVWLNVLLLTGFLALPAIFLVPGEAWFRGPLPGWPVTRQGVESALFLLGRALTAASFAALMILVTPWPQVLKSLRALRVPSIALFILSMSYRYIFLLLNQSLEMLLAYRSRQVGRLSRPQRRRMLVALGGALLGKSLQLAEEVFLAMQSRGYRGKQYTLLEFRMAPRDWAALTVIALAVLGALSRHV